MRFVITEELYNELVKLDKDAASKIHINNRKRVIRALDIIKNSSLTKSEIINKQKNKLIYKDVKFLFINPDRETLYSNINNRVDLMMENGLVDEVKNLLKKYDFHLYLNII